MKRYVYSNQHMGKLLRTEDALPVCGEAYCGTCGECLRCYGNDPCYRYDDTEGEHWWVVYEDEALEVSRESRDADGVNDL